MFEDLKERIELTNANKELVGKTVAERFQVLELIGEGGMSAVYKAKHLLLNQTCVLKVILPSRADERAIKRFQEEAKATSKLSHENIAALREFGVDTDGRPYLAMEFADGKSLADEIKQNGKLAPERVVDIILQACAGLEYAHKSGVFHRDIKPSNLVLSRTADGVERVKIVDFGIAKIFEPDNPQGSNLTQTGEVFGTPSYMSPEQCHGRQVDARSDVYSLGCVMYEALTGSQAAHGDSVLETIMQHINGVNLQFPPLTPPVLVNIIKQAVAKDPQNRYQRMQDFENDLRRVMASDGPASVAKVQNKSSAGVGIGLFVLGAVVASLVSNAVTHLSGLTPPPATSAPPAVVTNAIAPDVSIPNAKRPQAGDAVGWFEFGKQAQAGHVEEAIAAFKYVVQLTPNDPDAWFSLGENCLLLNRHKEAETAFTRATSLKPTDARFWFELGRAQHGMHKDFDAVKSFQQAIKLEPKYTLAWEELANSYYALDRQKEGEDARKQAGKLHGH